MKVLLIEKEKKVQTQNSIKDKLLAKWQLKLNNLLNMAQQKKTKSTNL